MRKMVALVTSALCLNAALASARAVAMDKINRSIAEVVVNKAGGVVGSFDVNFAVAAESTTNTLFFAYGATDGGDTTNGWEHVEIVAYVMPEDLTKHVVAPAGFGTELFHARFFLGEGMAVPYDTRYESYTKNGGSYIDTGFIPNQDTRVVADLTVNGCEYWFGCWAVSFGSGAFAVRWENTTQIYRGYGGCQNIKLDKAIETGKRYRLDFDKGTFSLTGADGSLGVATNAAGASTFSARPCTLYLYAFNQAGGCASGGAATFHGCQIYENGRLVRDYIPVSKDGTAYMFDLANAVLCPFLGGTPTAGAVVADDPYAKGAGPICASSEPLAFEDIRVFEVVRWDPAATGTGDGKSWANAYTDLAKAVERAGVYKGEVWIKGGTYTVDKSLTVRNNVAILGGFDGRDGAYADDDAERAARDPAVNKTVFTSANKTLVDLDKSGTVDATAVVDGIQFRNTSGGWLVYSSNTGAAYGTPTFTNCTFAGAAIALQRCAAAFYGCRFEALTGGSYGRIFLENTNVTVPFEDCTFAAVTNNSKYGLVNLASGGRSRFRRCRFEGCVGQASNGQATIHIDSTTPDALESCVFAGCQAAGGGIVSGMSMSDCRFESCRSTDSALLFPAGRVDRATFVGNVVHDEHPEVTSGTNHVDLLRISSQATTLVNCTFHGNVCKANYGEGATVIRSTVRWDRSSAMGGAVNCTFRNNAVDHDLTACGLVNDNKDYVNGYDVQLVNVVASNADPDYRAIRTFDCKTGGFCVYSSYLQGYVPDQAYAFVQLADDIRTDDPRCESKGLDDGLHRVVRLFSDSSARRNRGRNVEIGANGAIRFKNKFGTDIWRFNSSSAPTAPIRLLDDMLGNERPDGQFLPGSCQILLPSGMAVFLR